MNREIANQFRSATVEAIRMMGQSFAVERDGEHRTLQGRRENAKREIRSLHDADVEDGDVLTCPASGETFHVVGVERRVVGDQVTHVTVTYETPAQRTRRVMAEQRRDAPTFTITEAHNSIIGTQQHAHLAVTFDQRALDTEIDRHGGVDAAALKAMVAEIREMLDDQAKISKGSLVQYSELLERHSWIAGAVAQAVLGWATGSLKL
jgi:hypothetical protein